MHWFISFLLTVMLSACGATAQQQAQQRAGQQFSAESKHCETLYPDPYAKPVGARINCLNSAMINRFKGTNESDLAHVAAGHMRLLGQDYDSGKISASQLEHGMNIVLSDFKSKGLERINSMRGRQPIVCTPAGQNYICD